MSLPLRSRAAFTLVELLVVIGIIALLIAIILPSLAAARRVAQRTVCAARLKDQMNLASVFCASHRGYYPLVGIVPGVLPSALNDSNSTKYMYVDDINVDGGTYAGGTGALPKELAPIPLALTFQASKNNPYVVGQADAQNARQYEDEYGFIRQFFCPSEATSDSEINARVPYMDLFYFYPVPGGVEQGNGYWDRWRISYVYNEGALGWGPDNGLDYHRARGQSTCIRQPSKTMFGADGLPGIPDNTSRPDLDPNQKSGEGLASLYNNIRNPNSGALITAPVTMADALAGNGKAGDPQNFDKIRHQGKINVAFCDGHVETRSINSKDLNSIYLIAP